MKNISPAKKISNDFKRSGLTKKKYLFLLKSSNSRTWNQNLDLINQVLENWTQNWKTKNYSKNSKRHKKKLMCATKKC